MATTTKKGAKKTRAKPPRVSSEKSQLKHPQAAEELKRERDEALEQLAAASDILHMIAKAPANLQAVMDTIAENVARLCDANDVLVRRTDGKTYQTVSHFGSIPTLAGRENVSIDFGSVPGRAILDRRTIHVPDVQAAINEFPGAKIYAIPSGVKSVLVVPLLRNGIPLGIIHLRRLELRPFSDQQIRLLETFADQAVIAIENVRLFQELNEALEQQTATSEILGVIASSPTDIQPVLNAVAESAARLCEADDALISRIDGDSLKRVANYGSLPGSLGGGPTSIDRGSISGRAIIDRQTIHIHDFAAEPEDEFPNASLAKTIGLRTVLATPLLRESVPIGTIMIRRIEVRPFSDKQIKLLETFADQAVIAIENVRLFKELQERNRDLTEALEQQTATGEVLRVIASSPTELQPVLDTLVANAVKLSGAKQGHIRQLDGEFLRVVAHHNESPERIAVLQSNPLPVSPNIPGARAFLDRKPIHILDARLHAADAQFIARQTIPTSSDSGVRTLLAVPLLREGAGIGTITIWRDVVEPFTDRQIELVKTFADQAVIAIENVRLFKELRSAEPRPHRGVRAADCHERSAQGHQPLDV